MLTSHLAFSAEIDWDNSGSFEDDVAVDGLAWSTSRGRSGANDAFEAGTGDLVLRNGSGRYTPDYASSPLYPDVLPKRPFKLSCTFDGETYVLFRGFATPAEHQVGIDDPQIRFELFDQFEEWGLGRTNTPLALNQLTSENIADILDDVGFPSGRRQIDTGLSSMGVWTNHNRLPINALALCVQAEAGGRHYMANDGDYVFENREHRSKHAVTLTLTNRPVSPQIRQDEMRDTVRATWPRWEVGTEDVAVYVMFPVGKRLDPGVSEFEVEFTGLGASTSVSPVATTDYTANSQSDGSGVDKTNQVTVQAWLQTDSGGGLLTLNNIDQSPVYLTYLQVRGKPVLRGNETNAYKRETVAPVVSNQRLSVAFEFLDVADIAQGWVRLRAAVLGRMRRRPVVRIVPTDDAMMHAMLGIEISDRVSITDTGASWTSQVAGEYIVEGIDYEWDRARPNQLTTVLRLFDEALAMADGFRISGAVAGGEDYDAIVSSSATTGKRIWMGT